MSTQKNIRAYLNSNDIAATMTGYLNSNRWGAESLNVSSDLLCFTANTDGSTIKIEKKGTPASVTLQYCTNGKDWNTYSFGKTITLLNAGSKIWFKNSSQTDTGFSTGYDDYYKFVMTGSIAGSGNINYLLNTNSTTTVPNYGYISLFNGCSSLTSSPELPATTIGTCSYEGMFVDCTGLTTPPQLPAMSAPSRCYFSMFLRCTNLIEAPALPATTVASGCYHDMFNRCSNLIRVPSVLPASTLASGCYASMFTYCTNLTTVPSLPATTLNEHCYDYMFAYCSNLMELPSLPATTLSYACYQGMFRSCSKIKISETQTGEYVNKYRIPTSGTGTSASSALGNMFAGTGGTFKSTPTINTTYYTSNTIVL